MTATAFRARTAAVLLGAAVLATAWALARMEEGQVQELAKAEVSRLAWVTAARMDAGDPVEAAMSVAAGGDYGLRLFDGDREVARFGAGEGARWKVSARVPAKAGEWRLELWPEPAWIRGRRTLLPATVVTLGLLLSVLAAYCLSLLARTEAQARELSAKRDEALGLAREATDARARLQETARALERSNRDLEQFASAASHDLQEPLRMVASYTQLLSRRFTGKLGPEADGFIANARDGALKMQEMIKGLLAYSRIGQGGADESVDTDKALDAALTNLSTAVRESGAHVTRGPLPLVRGDLLLTTQLFQNLLGNALKYRGSRVPEVSVTAERRDAAWEFCVRDNGIGIAPDATERVFQLFQRLHTQEEIPGTGLGLAACKKIVEHGGGRIWVRSVPDNGSDFHFTVPDRA